MSTFASTLLAVAVAHAVRGHADPDCPGAEAVHERAAALIGRVPAEHELRAELTVHAGPPWRIELETIIDGRAQRRTLQGARCQAVADAAALILAVSVDPVVVSDHAVVGRDPDVLGPPRAASVGPPPDRSDPTRPPRIARASARGSSSRTRGSGSSAPLATARVPADGARRSSRSAMGWRLRAGGGGELGAVPGGTGGPRLGLALEGARGHLRLDGSYWIDRARLVRLPGAVEPVGAQVGLGTATLAGGVRLGGPRVGVPLSLGIEAGGLRTRGIGLARARALTMPWLAGLVGAGVRFDRSARLGLWIEAEAYLPLLRPRVQAGASAGSAGGTPGRVLHEVGAVGGRILAGISVRLAAPRRAARSANGPRTP